MKREYVKPSVLMVRLHHQTTLLAGGSVIGQGDDNEEPAAPLFDDPAWDALLGE